jgi:hypothetical protein
VIQRRLFDSPSSLEVPTKTWDNANAMSRLQTKVPTDEGSDNLPDAPRRAKSIKVGLPPKAVRMIAAQKSYSPARQLLTSLAPIRARFS